MDSKQTTSEPMSISRRRGGGGEGGKGGRGERQGSKEGGCLEIHARGEWVSRRLASSL